MVYTPKYNPVTGRPLWFPTSGKPVYDCGETTPSWWTLTNCDTGEVTYTTTNLTAYGPVAKIDGVCYVVGVVTSLPEGVTPGAVDLPSATYATCTACATPTVHCCGYEDDGVTPKRIYRIKVTTKAFVLQEAGCFHDYGAPYSVFITNASTAGLVFIVEPDGACVYNDYQSKSHLICTYDYFTGSTCTGTPYQDSNGFDQLNLSADMNCIEFNAEGSAGVSDYFGRFCVSACDADGGENEFCTWEKI